MQIIIPQPQDVNEHIAAGKVRPIAALTEKRLTVLPNVPTIKEQGINVPIIANARGVLAPPRIASDVVGYWENFFVRLIKTPSWKSTSKKTRLRTSSSKAPSSAHSWTSRSRSCVPYCRWPVFRSRVRTKEAARLFWLRAVIA